MRASAIGAALALGVLMGWLSWRPAVPAHGSATMRVIQPTLRTPESDATSAAELLDTPETSATPAERDPAKASALWTKAQWLWLCGRRGIYSDPSTVERDLKLFEAVSDGAEQHWRDTPEEQRPALVTAWQAQLTARCGQFGQSDDKAVYVAYRNAAQQGSRDAAIAFLGESSIYRISMGRDFAYWADWSRTAPRVLDQLVADGDAEALFLRAVAEGFADHTAIYEVRDWTFLINAVRDDPERAYRDLRRYLASGDTVHRDLAMQLLPLLGASLDPARQRAIDVELASP